jgi:GntR family transcriptional regulator, carbon starvation induced regulator
MNQLAPHKSRTARTYELLRDLIVDARYAPGEKLRIDHLSRELDVSSGAVREALSRLTAEGLVVAEPQKGFVVAPISRRDLKDLTDVRIEIENRCLTESIEKGDVDWEGRVLSIHHRLSSLKSAYLQRGTADAQRWHEMHEEFHRQLTSACENRWWLRLRRQLYIQSDRYRRLSGPLDETNRDIEAEHTLIANAALARDTEAAVRHMSDHLSRTTAILLTSRIPFTED